MPEMEDRALELEWPTGNEVQTAALNDWVSGLNAIAQAESLDDAKRMAAEMLGKVPDLRDKAETKPGALRRKSTWSALPRGSISKQGPPVKPNLEQDAKRRKRRSSSFMRVLERGATAGSASSLMESVVDQFLKAKKGREEYEYIMYTDTPPLKIDFRENMLVKSLFGSRVALACSKASKIPLVLVVTVLLLFVGIFSFMLCFLPGKEDWAPLCALSILTPLLMLWPFTNTELCWRLLQTFETVFVLGNALTFSGFMMVLSRDSAKRMYAIVAMQPVLLAIPFYDSLPPLLRDRAAKITQPLVLLVFIWLYLGFASDSFEIRDITFFGFFSALRVSASCALNLAVFGMKNSANAHFNNSSTFVVLKAKLKMARVLKGFTDVIENARLKDSLLERKQLSKPIQRGFLGKKTKKGKAQVYATELG